MTLLHDFARVTRRLPCPVCGKPNWCLRAREGGDQPVAAICQRVESGRQWGEAGWLHRLADRQRSAPKPRPVVRPKAEVAQDFDALSREFQGACTPARLHRLARILQLEVLPLQALRVGWTGRAWSFPMSDANGRVIGIRLRFPDGAKRAIKGSRQGLFVPLGDTPAEWLFIAEGPSDAAALLQIGLQAIGRPSCSGGADLVGRFVRLRKSQHVVIVSDADLPGQRGADCLADELALACRDVRVIGPPGGHGDARDAVVAGADRGTFQMTAAAARSRQLTSESIWRAK